MKICEFYKKHTWGEPPLEPDENGTIHTELTCVKVKGFLEVRCEGDIENCDIGEKKLGVRDKIGFHEPYAEGLERMRKEINGV